MWWHCVYFHLCHDLNIYILIYSFIYLNYIYMFTYLCMIYAQFINNNKEKSVTIFINTLFPHEKSVLVNRYFYIFNKPSHYCTTFCQDRGACVVSYVVINVLPMRSAGPVPRFSPRMVTLVQAAPSLGEMPVTSGGWRARDMVTRGRQEHWISQHLDMGKKKKAEEGLGEKYKIYCQFSQIKKKACRN